MRRIPSLLSLTALALAVGCNDSTRPVTPQPVAGGPNAAISDGSFGGNPDFFFLPTLAPDPRKNPNFDPGKFNPNLAPVVKVCRLDATTAAVITPGTSCVGSPLVTLSGSAVKVLPQIESYLAVWNLRTAPPDPHKFYRIQVFVGSTLLGFVDVSVVTTLGEARLALTGEVLPLVPGLTLPIPFRIETGALGACKRSTDCTEVSVTPQGGTFFTSTHHAALQLTPGWARADAFAAGGGSIQLTIERRTLGEGKPACHAGATGTLYEQQPVCYHYATDPSIAAYGGLQTADNVAAQCSIVQRTLGNSLTEEWVLFKSDPEMPLQPLRSAPEPTGLECANFAFMENLPSNPVLRFASLGWHSVTSAAARAVGVRDAYAWDDGLGGHLLIADPLSDFSWGKALKKGKIWNPETTVDVGVAVYPKVKITTYHHGNSLANVPVTFSTVNGTITGGEGGTKVAYTNETGEASVEWYVAAGANTLLARAPTLDLEPLTFTAQGIGPFNGAWTGMWTNTVAGNTGTLTLRVTSQSGASAVGTYDLTYELLSFANGMVNGQTLSLVFLSRADANITKTEITLTRSGNSVTGIHRNYYVPTSPSAPSLDFSISLCKVGSTGCTPIITSSTVRSTATTLGAVTPVSELPRP